MRKAKVVVLRQNAIRNVDAMMHPDSAALLLPSCQDKAFELAPCNMDVWPLF